MVRLVTVYCPPANSDAVESTIKALQSKYVYQLTRATSDHNVIFSFKAKDKQVQDILEEIGSTGCGRVFGHIDVTQVLLSRPPISSLYEHNLLGKKKKRQYRVSERMTVDEISCFIDDGNHLTFNYMILLLMASMIAGVGLLMDSATTVIASMLVSPLMGPILSITFGCAVHDFEYIQRGMRNEIIGILISLVTGFVIGIAGGFIYDPSYRSSEMVGRGQGINLVGGFVVAFASGVAVIVAVTMGGVNAIVGTAISASLLPPIVNAGVCWAMSFIYSFMENTGHDSYQYSVFGAFSFCLFIVNFVTIVAVGFLTFRFVKDVKPEHSRTYSISLESTKSSTVDKKDIQLNALHESTDSSSKNSRLSNLAVNPEEEEVKQ